jgi:hypothetical protein
MGEVFIVWVPSLCRFTFQIFVKTVQFLQAAYDTAEAEKLATELDKEFPLDTLVQRYWLPTIRAAIALEGTNPTLTRIFLL